METLTTGETDRVSNPNQGWSGERNTAWVARPSLDVILVLLLALVSTATLLWLIREPNFVDDADYFEYASWLLGGEPGSPRIANLYRLGFISAVVASQGIFGYTPTAYYVVSIGFSVGAVVALYVFSRTLRFPRLVALSAAVLLLTSPIFLEYATILRVDWPAIFWILLGLSALMAGVRSERPYRTRVLMSVAAGIALFFALWTKEAAIPLVAASSLVVLGVRRDDQSWKLVGIAAGAGALLLGGELLLLTWQYGDPLARVSAILGGHVTGAATGWVESGLISADLTWWHLGLRYPQLLLETTYGRIFAAVAIGGLVTALATRRRELLLLAALGLWGAMFISFAVVSVDPLVPLLRTKARYFSMAFVFLASRYSQSVKIKSILPKPPMR